MFLAVSEIVQKVDEAFWWIGGICLFFLVGITLTMVIFVVRYRRKRNPRPASFEGNTPLEITWIVIPTILVLFMFYKGLEGFILMRAVPADAMQVEVTAQQWFWTFRYPEADVTSPELYVPVDTPVECLLTAPESDVVHSFYLPAFRVKEDCVPGKRTHLWFEAEKTGTYNIFCAEFCGKNHAKMISRLHVLPEAEFRAWLEKKIADQYKPVDMAKAMDRGSKEIRERDGPGLFLTYCASCHGKDGRGGLVEGARNFHSLEGWKRSPKITDIFRTLTEGIEGTRMRSFANLPAWDRFALAHHVVSFYAGKDRPKSTPGEVEALRKEYRLDEVKAPRKTLPIEKAMELILREQGGGAEKKGD